MALLVVSRFNASDKSISKHYWSTRRRPVYKYPSLHVGGDARMELYLISGCWDERRLDQQVMILRSKGGRDGAGDPFVKVSCMLCRSLLVGKFSLLVGKFCR